MSRIIYGSSAGVVAAVGIALAVLFLGAKQGVETSAARAETPRPSSKAPAQATEVQGVQVSMVHPTMENLERVIIQPAQVEPYERTDVYAKAAGFVTNIAVDIGDRVEKDQLLAELWIPEMEQEGLKKQALVEQARAAVDQAKAQVGSAEARIAAAEAKVAETGAAISQHEADVNFRRSEHRRIAELVKSRSVNESLQDEKLQQLLGAEASLAAAQARIKSMEAQVSVEQAGQQQAQADLAHAQAFLAVATAELRHTEIVMQYARIRAPYAGLITRRWVDSGAFVASAASNKLEPLFTVDRVDKLRIVFDVPEADTSLVRVGQLASLSVDALKGMKFDGQVVRTAGALSSKTRTLRVEADVANPNGHLRAGMFGMLSVTIATPHQAIMIPARCLRYEDSGPYVLCANRGVVEKRQIEIGYRDGIRCEVIEGLNATDNVIADSSFPVQPGQAVHLSQRR